MDKKITWHSSVNYVEPNDVNSMAYTDENDATHYINKAPKLEDYSIALGLEVELASRSLDIEIDRNSRKLTMIYKNGEQGNTINFYKGSVFDGSGEATFLTSYYADMTSEDLRTYSTTEMLGIKSVNVEYGDFCIPQITIVFTDVRGMSLFQPSDIARDLKNTGFSELDSKNVTNAFFRSFFLVPSPKFTIYLKGLYGQPVAYQMTCIDFRASFDSESGSFDTTVKFVGYTFSFLTEVSVNALIAAPYSDYEGKEYWNKNVSNGRFKVRANKSNPNEYREMPTLCELVTDIYKVTNESATEVGDSDLSAPLKDNSEEIEELEGIVNLYTRWYDTLFSAINERFNLKDRVTGEPTRAAEAFRSRSYSSYYDFGVVYIPTKMLNSIKTFEDVYNEIKNKDVTEVYTQLKNKIAEFNSYHTLQLNDIPNFNEIKSQKFIKNIKEILPSDNHTTVKYEYELDSQSVFSDEFIRLYPRLTDDTVLRYGYRNGIDYKGENGDRRFTNMNVIYIDVNYIDIVNRIKTLKNKYTQAEIEDASAAIAELQKKLILKKLSWYPSIENFTMIMMAHLETLMHILFVAIEKMKGRTASELGVSLGVDGEGKNCSDVPINSTTVPPFPRITTTSIETGAAGDTITVKQDAWIGDIGASKIFEETEVVNGLLNAANEVNSKITHDIQASREWERDITNQTDGRISVVPFPLTAFDYFLTENPYGNSQDTVSSFATFAAKVALRMYTILGLNNYVNEFNDENGINFLSDENIKCLGSVEAENFYLLNRMTNPDLRQSLANKTLTSKDIIDIIQDKNTTYKGSRWPWDFENDSRPLFGDGDKFYPNYETEDGNLYPVQGFNLSDIAQKDLLIYRDKKPDFTNNRNVVSPLLDQDGSYDLVSLVVGSSISRLNYAIIIDDELGRVESFIKDGESRSNNENYSALFNEIIRISTIDNVQDTYVNLLNTNSRGSICGKIGAGEINHSDSKYRIAPIGVDELLYDIATREKNGNNSGTYFSGLESFKNYLHGESSANYIQSIFLSEVFGFYKANGRYFIDTNASLFFNLNYYNIANGDGWDKDLFNGKYVKAAFFVMCIQVFNYSSINDYIKNKTHIFLPRLLVLQLGALFAAEYYAYGKKFAPKKPLSYSVSDSRVRKIQEMIPLPNGFITATQSDSTPFLKTVLNFSKAAKLEFIRYFVNWADSAQDCLTQFELDRRSLETDGVYTYDEIKKISNDDNYNVSQLHSWTEERYTDQMLWLPKKETYRTSFIVNRNTKTTMNNYVSGSRAIEYSMTVRLLFNELDENVNKMTNSLMQSVCITRCHNLSDKKESRYIDINKSTVFLDSFLGKLSDIINEQDNGGETSNSVRTTIDPKQVTTDMKIALYLYLKQLYDKWIPNTTMSDWNFDNFFGNGSGDSYVSTRNGHKFHFIDAFYTKIGQKLMINPEMLSDKLQRSMLNVDWNAMLLQFMSDIYADHHCAFKCIQNFNDITTKESMEKMFLPISYFDMQEPKRNPDFVVIYTYQPSSNLNLGQGEYEDDGFMLNDKDLSPMAIARRTIPPSMNSDSDELGWYQLPAFGVVYGSQYQSYFKKIDISMDNPIATEASIGAKYRVGNMYRIDSSKSIATTAQDLYDIHSNRSYTCKIQMMGCAWVQPLMYFVLLNIPMFNGSYIITKVSHSMTPGNMDTDLEGVRMSKIATRLTDEVFSDEDHNDTSKVIEDLKYKHADAANDCNYRPFPIHNEVGNYTITNAEKNVGVKIYKMLRNSGFSEFAAASSVGCMYGECRWDHTKLIVDSGKYLSGGLCQWNKGNLKALCYNLPERYFCIDVKEVPNTKGEDSNGKMITENYNFWKSKLNSLSLEDSVTFYVNTFKTTNCFSHTIDEFNRESTSIEKGVIWWYRNYGIGTGAERIKGADGKWHNKLTDDELLKHKDAHMADRIKAAKDVLEDIGKEVNESINNHNDQISDGDFSDLFYAAVIKTFNASVSNSSISPKDIRTVTGNKRLIWFGEKSGRCYKIFDIIMTTYYDYVSEIRWVYDKNDISGDASYIIVGANEKNKIERRYVSVAEVNASGEVTKVPDPSKFNINFFRTIKKVYVSDNDVSKPSKGDILVNMLKDGKFTSEIKKVLSSISILNCSSTIENLPSFNNGASTLHGMKLENVTNDKLKILLDINNNGKNYHALDFMLKSASQNYRNYFVNKFHKEPEVQMTKIGDKDFGEGWRIYSKVPGYNTGSYVSCCTSGPKGWYSRIGVALRFWGSAKTSTFEELRKNFEPQGMTLVWHGTFQEAYNKFSNNNPEGLVPGDVATFHVISRSKKNGRITEKPTSHGQMWTGSDWRSDAIQRDFSCYSKDSVGRQGDHSVCIWRYKEFLT